MDDKQRNNNNNATHFIPVSKIVFMNSTYQEKFTFTILCIRIFFKSWPAVSRSANTLLHFRQCPRTTLFILD